jgi:molecular chaperone GrpE
MVKEIKKDAPKHANENKKADEITEIKLKCEEYLNGWKRERADFLNYKKEETERISSLVKYANEDLIFKILPVLDNLYLAQNHINDNGLAQVIKQFEDFLKQEGVEPIEVLEKQFDPNIMEAVGDVPADANGSGVAKEEVQKGYTLNGKLIRPAKVKISK